MHDIYCTVYFTLRQSSFWERDLPFQSCLTYNLGLVIIISQVWCVFPIRISLKLLSSKKGWGRNHHLKYQKKEI